MAILYKTNCCGLKEIHNLSGYINPKKALKAVCKEFLKKGNNGKRGAFLVFTQALSYEASDYGDRLKEYIIKNNLGGVIETPLRRNPNSGNTLKTYVWTVKPRKLHSWYKNNK